MCGDDAPEYADIVGAASLFTEDPGHFPSGNHNAAVPAFVGDPDESAQPAQRNRTCSSTIFAVELLAVLVGVDLRPVLPGVDVFTTHDLRSLHTTIIMQTDSMVGWQAHAIHELATGQPRARAVFVCESGTRAEVSAQTNELKQKGFARSAGSGTMIVVCAIRIMK
jgi:hypothetical protein